MSQPTDKALLEQIRKQASDMRFIAQTTGLLDAAEQFSRKLAGLSYDKGVFEKLPEQK